MAAVALTTTVVVHHSLAIYERWSWDHLPLTRHLTLRAQVAVIILRAFAQHPDAQPHAAVAAAALLLGKARGLDLVSS